jgi:guanine deaminase
VYAASKEDAARAGFDDDDIYRELARDWRERRSVGEQLLPEEGRAVLEAWVANRSKIEY